MLLNTLNKQDKDGNLNIKIEIIVHKKKSSTGCSGSLQLEHRFHVLHFQPRMHIFFFFNTLRRTAKCPECGATHLLLHAEVG